MKHLNAKNAPTILLIFGLTLCFLSFWPPVMSLEMFLPIMIASSLAILAKAVIELFRPSNEWLKIAIRTFVLMFLYALFMPAWAKMKMTGAVRNFPQPLDLFGMFVVSCLMANPIVAAIKFLQFLIQRRKS